MHGELSDRREGRSHTAMIGIAALVLVGLVGFSYREWREYSRADANAARTSGVVDSVDALPSSLIDAETGQRGFLLTDDSRYLQPYNQAVKAIPGQMAQLNTLLAHRRGESENIAQLDRLVNAKMAELRQTIILRRTRGAQAADRAVLGLTSPPCCL
ncbi:MAG: CHASE3 domain-containing protein [Terriglobia bacterium]